MCDRRSLLVALFVVFGCAFSEPGIIVQLEATSEADWVALASEAEARGVDRSFQKAEFGLAYATLIECPDALATLGALLNPISTAYAHYVPLTADEADLTAHLDAMNPMVADVGEFAVFPESYCGIEVWLGPSLDYPKTYEVSGAVDGLPFSFEGDGFLSTRIDFLEPLSLGETEQSATVRVTIDLQNGLTGFEPVAFGATEALRERIAGSVTANYRLE